MALSVLGFRVTSRTERRSIATKLIIACYEGLHAQQLVEPQAEEYHGENDEGDAYELSLNYEVLPRGRSRRTPHAHDRYLDRLRRKAGQLVRRHREAIAALAAELLIKSELNGPAVNAIVEPLLVKRAHL